ncbi:MULTISPECIES: hypothetical protein [unclassified Mesorhizobium]|uniref:hypothetical protein n=1 Tax=unclassified Mesorhizobium TaxID=325217 RepID=UPI0033392615
MEKGPSVLMRGMSEKKINALWALTKRPEGNWWQDLLRSWAPSGSPLKGQRQLRLALRDEYLNFYHCGQSLARVSLDRRGHPKLEVHHKYVFDDVSGQTYMSLSDQTVRYKSTAEREAPYQGIQTMTAWIKRANTYSGYEKSGVECIVAANEDVIDLEMGIPWWPEQAVDASTPERTGKYAPRMDMIALEDGPRGLINIVFWEAKTLGDKRLRSRSTPEVIRQLQVYNKYLNRAPYRDAACAAYVETCKLLKTFHEMATHLPGATSLPPLGNLVSRIASGAELPVVDPMPRLLIFPAEVSTGNFERQVSTWSRHLAKLTSEFPVYSVPDPKAAVLASSIRQFDRKPDEHIVQAASAF